MPAKKSANARPNPYLDLDEADMSPAEVMARDILDGRADLQPSVERIMSAGLDDDAAARALELFRTSLTQPGDPHRDPRAAIAAVTGTSAT